MKTLRMSVFLVLCSAVLSWAPVAHAAAGPERSPDGLWTRVAPANVAALFAEGPELESERRPEGVLFTLDVQRLQAILREAESPARLLEAQPGQPGPALSIPLPGGGFARFRIEPSDILAPELAAQFPEIRTYHGQGIEEPAATVQLDLSPTGFHAQVLYPDRSIVVDPYQRDEYVYAAYEKTSVKREPFRCDVQRRQPSEARPEPGGAEGAQATGFLRIYRLAVAATGEYVAFHGGTVADGLAAIVTTVNRVSGIYQRELAIQLQLVANNQKLIFTDPLNDPFTGDNADQLIEESQAEIDQIIGDAHYDLGHTFSKGSSSKAQLGVACQTGWKALGVTGIDSPVGDPFDVDYVAHEMGHQLKADHTFNSVLGDCRDFWNKATAVEPGSGSTILGYAGLCEKDDNLQDYSDDYFHAVSLVQMLEYTRQGPGQCGILISHQNRPPTVDAGADRKIPRDTPFVLAANGVDPDDHALTYSWEQVDPGPQARLDSADDGTIPLFRSFPPTKDPSRTFPRLLDLLRSSPSRGELLPKKARTLTFHVTVRDNRADGGNVASDEMKVTVVETAGPFEVTAPRESRLTAGPVRVAWEVAKTDQEPIRARFVNILLLTDNGEKSEILRANTRNDGQETVNLPARSIPEAWIKVESADNIFFALSRSFQISIP